LCDSIFLLDCLILIFVASLFDKVKRFCSRRATFEETFLTNSLTLSVTMKVSVSASTLLSFSMIAFVLALSWERWLLMVAVEIALEASVFCKSSS